MTDLTNQVSDHKEVDNQIKKLLESSLIEQKFWAFAARVSSIAVIVIGVISTIAAMKITEDGPITKMTLVYLSGSSAIISLISTTVGFDGKWAAMRKFHGDMERLNLQRQTSTATRDSLIAELEEKLDIHNQAVIAATKSFPTAAEIAAEIKAQSKLSDTLIDSKGDPQKGA